MADTYPVGALVPLTFHVTDEDGTLADATSASLTITFPDGITTTSPALTHTETGVYTHDFPTSIPGPYTARFVATGTNAGALEDLFLVTETNLSVITAAQLRAYCRDLSPQFDDAELLDALAAERAAQVNRCFLDPYTADLREALLRRVDRNLAARAVKLTSYSSFEGGATTTKRLPPSDPEVTRLEGPHRRFGVG